MRTLRATVLLFIITAAAFAATAQTQRRDEVSFQIASATVQKFAKEQPSREGAYSEALVLRLDASAADYENLPPSVQAFLYIGTHQLRPLSFVWDRERVTVTFHDPRWKELQGGEIMVLTTRHGDPITDPGRYAGYPRFDPKVITER